MDEDEGFIEASEPHLIFRVALFVPSRPQDIEFCGLRLCRRYLRRLVIRNIICFSRQDNILIFIKGGLLRTVSHSVFLNLLNGPIFPVSPGIASAASADLLAWQPAAYPAGIKPDLAWPCAPPPRQTLAPAFLPPP